MELLKQQPPLSESMVGTELHGLRVITVEDDADLRSLWRVKYDHFEIDGIILDPHEAMQLPVEEWRNADLLVTDWSMGDYTGKDIIQRALECNPTINCHVLTAMPNPYGLPVGVKVWLKPIPIEIIIQEAIRDN